MRSQELIYYYYYVHVDKENNRQGTTDRQTDRQTDKTDRKPFSPLQCAL